MIKLLVNADDFGYSRGVNHGIIDAHRFGIVNSTTMLVNMPGTEHAIELAKENPDLKVGVHLTLTCGRAMASGVPSLVDQDGRFRMTKRFEDFEQVKLDEVDKEWEAQIEYMIQGGLKPSHFDSHHHIHAQPRLLPVVQRLSEKYDLPVRNVFGNKPVGVKLLTDVFFDDFFGEEIRVDYFKQLKRKMTEGQTVEVMCHPAYVDEALLSGSSYHLKRAKELDVLMNTKLDQEFQLL
ncbi:chitin disaccharide deacetylase [Pseudalkalibacillus sp. Hm43]|uniref:chitin disaccharide deacetylase n=1 Tax=Pseudalkalibacillus sp. Hm43 TaxID=3450742 RepID=UPI003F424885